MFYRTLEENYKTDESFVEFLELRGRNSDFTLEELLELPVSNIEFRTGAQYMLLF